MKRDDNSSTPDLLKLFIPLDAKSRYVKYENRHAEPEINKIQNSDNSDVIIKFYLECVPKAVDITGKITLPDNTQQDRILQRSTVMNKER